MFAEVANGIAVVLFSLQLIYSVDDQVEAFALLSMKYSQSQ